MRQASRDQRSITELALKLRAHREEIEAAALTRVFAVSEPPAAIGPEYVQGLRRAVAAALDYGIGSIGRSEVGAPSPPPVLLAQAARAARSGVGLDTVLRRYLAGHAILADFLVELDGGELPPAVLKRVIRRLAAAADHLVAAVSREYGEVSEGDPRHSDRQRVEIVERLVAGEPLDASELGYELDGHHVGLVAHGPGAGEAIRALAAAVDRRLLLVCSEEGAHWAWVGGRREFDAEELELLCRPSPATGLRLALGEPGEGAAGWRLTHQQAQAALSVALHSGRQIVRYREAALLSCVVQDELLATSLRRLYLEPLEVERDGGTALRETLHAYFTAQGNLSSAAAALGVSRKTVNSRLRAVEQHLGLPLSDCAAPLELAIQMAQLFAEPEAMEERRLTNGQAHTV